MFKNIVMFPSKYGQRLYGVDQTPQMLRYFLSPKNMYYPINVVKD